MQQLLVLYIYIYINTHTSREPLLYGQNYRDLLPITDKLKIYRLFGIRIYLNALPRGQF